MKIQAWMIAVGSSIVLAAIAWGSLKTTVDNHEVRIKNLETMKDAVIGIDTKVDMLLSANGIELKSKGVK